MQNELQNVFVRSGVPTHTFVEPDRYKDLVLALKTRGRGLIVEGPSGIGKTTAITKALGEVGVRQDITRLNGRLEEDVELLNSYGRHLPKGTIIVDDFHKLPPAVQGTLVNRIKVLADENNPDTKIVLLGIPNLGKPLVSLGLDAVARVDVLTLAASQDKKVEQLLTLGEIAMNVEFKEKADYVRLANGSLSMAQQIGFHACKLADIVRTSDSTTLIEIKYPRIRAEILEGLHNRFWEISLDFAKGRRERKEGHAPYLHILYWLAQAKEQFINIPEHARRNEAVMHSVSQVLKKDYLKGLIDQTGELDTLIHYDENNKSLYIDDPQYGFYLQNLSWDVFQEKLGSKLRDSSHKYDLAISFAGPERDFARQLYHSLCEDVYVFFDENIAPDQFPALSEHLKTVYSDRSGKVAVVFSDAYYQRYWTNEEFKSIINGINQDDIIAIYVQPQRPDPTSIFFHAHYLTYDPSKGMDEEVGRLSAEILKILLG